MSFSSSLLSIGQLLTPIISIFPNTTCATIYGMIVVVIASLVLSLLEERSKYRTLFCVSRVNVNPLEIWTTAHKCRIRNKFCIYH
jgi:hypothetical protein